MSDDNVQIISLTHHQNLLEAMRILQRSGRLCDITVEVDFQGKSQEYDTHRLVLAATSGYFKNLLLANDSLRKAPLNDLPPAEFDAFLEYAYTGRVEVARTFIPNILKTAVFLDCTDLVDACKAVTDLQATKSETGAPPDTKAVVKSPQRRQVKGRGRPPSKTSARIETSIDSQELQEPGHKGRRLSHRLACRDNPAGTPESKLPRRGRPRAGESCKKKGPQDGAGEKGEQGDPASPVDMDQEGVSSREDQSSVSDNTSLTSDDEIQEDPKDKDFCLVEKVAEEELEEEEGEESEKTIESGTSRVTFQCEKCERSFLYQKSFLKHMRVAHGEQPEVTHRCGTCHQTFANRGNLKIHEQHVHSEERLYPCDVCTKAFKRSKDVRRHKRQVHDGGERHHCAECSKTLSSRTALKLHQRTHTGYRPYECPECGAKFSQTSALKTHLRIHTGEKPYACDECDARFTQKHMLAYHKRSHTGEKPFMCENCGKSFASKEYLKHHARIHSGSRPYKCDVCDRAFAQRNSLHQHMKTHTGERPYECTSCEKRFTQLNALQRHQRIHTGEKPYMCTLCNRTFTDKSTLRRHAMTHDKETPWRNYLMVLENNVEDPTKKTRAPNTPTKKDQAPSKEGPPTSKSPKSTNVAMTTTVTTVTPAATVTGDPVTLAAEWGGPGTITLVSHGTLGGFTVIQTEGGGASQLQPLVTADGTPVTVPLALPITVSHPSGSVRPSGTSAASAFPIAVPVSVAKALTHVQMPAGPAAILAPVGTVDVASSAELEAAMAAGEIQCVTVDNGEQVVETEETAKVEGSPVQLISDDGAQVAETTVTMEVTTSTISEEPSQ